MNTTKIIVFSIVILLSLNFLQGQEKQNDANWEECIEFINENITSINGYTYHDTNYDKQGQSIGTMLWHNQYSINNTEFSAKQNRTIYTLFGKRSDVRVYSLNLKNLKIADNGPSYETINTKIGGNGKFNFGTITIRTTDELYLGKESYGISNDASNTQMILIIKDDEMRGRILKAFKQLAYLAGEKRKKSKF